MATQAARIAPADCSLPLYRMDVGTYMRLVDAGALEGVEVELLDGLLVNKWPHREDAIHRLDVGTYERMVASGVLDGQRIELLEGLLVEVSPHGPDHAEVIRRLTRYLAVAQGKLAWACSCRWKPGGARCLNQTWFSPRGSLLAVAIRVLRCSPSRSR